MRYFRRQPPPPREMGRAEILPDEITACFVTLSVGGQNIKRLLSVSNGPLLKWIARNVLQYKQKAACEFLKHLPNAWEEEAADGHQQSSASAGEITLPRGKFQARFCAASPRSTVQLPSTCYQRTLQVSKHFLRSSHPYLHISMCQVITSHGSARKTSPEIVLFELQEAC